MLPNSEFFNLTDVADLPALRENLKQQYKSQKHKLKESFMKIKAKMATASPKELQIHKKAQQRVIAALRKLKREHQQFSMLFNDQTGTTFGEQNILANVQDNKDGFISIQLDSGAHFQIPVYIHRRLFVHQKQALNWLLQRYSQRLGCILGDEMGLGKTICIISFISAIYSTPEKAMFPAMNRFLNTSPSLIICPATLIDQWSAEIELWTDSIEQFDVQPQQQKAIVAPQIQQVEQEIKKDLHLKSENGDDRQQSKKATQNQLDEAAKIEFKIFKSSDVNQFDKTLLKRISLYKNSIFICSYELFRSKQEQLLAQEWRVCILDQGQRVKNPMAKISQAVCKIKTNFRVIMSGTPIQNSLVELWSLFNFINPGMLGNLGEFEEKYKEPILKAGYARARPLDKWHAKQCAQNLRQKIKPYILRRQKCQIDSLFPKQKQFVLSVKLTDFQVEIYQQYIKALKPQMARQTQNAALRALDLLRKLCNHPFLFFLTMTNKHRAILGYEDVDFTIDKLREYSKLLKFTPKSQEEVAMLNEESKYWLYTAKLAAKHFQWSGKLLLLKKILPQWKREGNRTLIFSQSRKMLEVIELFVRDQLGLSYVRIDGNTDKKQRIKIVNAFNSGTQDLFLLTTKVGGIGVNLTGANRVLIFEPDWNPMNDSQAKERALRIGQKRKVEIYRLVSDDSIEQKIYYRQVFKMFVANKVLNDPSLTKLFQTSQLQDLFEAPKGAEEEEKAGGLVAYELFKFGSEELRHDQKYEKFKNSQSKRLEKVQKLAITGGDEFEKEIMEELME